jgi:hypothetical protein
VLNADSGAFGSGFNEFSALRLQKKKGLDLFQDRRPLATIVAFRRNPLEARTFSADAKPMSGDCATTLFM